MTTLDYTSTAGDPALDAAFERALAGGLAPQRLAGAGGLIVTRDWTAAAPT